MDRFNRANLVFYAEVDGAGGVGDVVKAEFDAVLGDVDTPRGDHRRECMYRILKYFGELLAPKNQDAETQEVLLGQPVSGNEELFQYAVGRVAVLFTVDRDDGGNLIRIIVMRFCESFEDHPRPSDARIAARRMHKYRTDTGGSHE